MNYTIYRCTNVINSKVYIGKTSTTPKQRFKGHLKDARTDNPECIFHRALKKHGPLNFIIETLATTANPGEIDLLEKKFIAENDCCILDGEHKGYNMTRGGDGFDSDTVSKNNRRRVADGTHPWAGERGSVQNSKTQQARIAKGTFHFQGAAGSAHSTALHLKHVAEGTNPWAGELGSAQSKAVAARLLAEGRHHSQQKLTCPNCGKVGAGNALKRWHFKNCRQTQSSAMS
jgi:hypothetical protein